MLKVNQALLPVLRAIDDISDSLPNEGFHYHWNFVERPVIVFEDAAVAERDSVDLGLERVLESKSWTTTRFLCAGDKFLRSLFRYLKK